jgi:hypothetical protein
MLNDSWAGRNPTRDVVPIEEEEEEEEGMRVSWTSFNAPIGQEATWNKWKVYNEDLHKLQLLT